MSFGILGIQSGWGVRMANISAIYQLPPEDMAEFCKMKRKNGGVGHASREIFQGIGSMPQR